jgi:Flp pilus assembly protein TadD
MANLLKKSKAASNIEQAFAAMRLGQADRVVRLLERALREAPKNFEALTLLAGLRGQQGRFSDAAALFERAVAVRPDSAETQYNLGVALTHLGSRERAIACYRNALRSNPRHLDACNNLAAELLTLKRAEEALTVLQKGLLYHPANAVLINKLGVALKDTGAIDEAIAKMRQAVLLMPSNATIHANLGVALREASRFDEAVESLRRAVTITAHEADFHNNLALALHYNGQLDTAIESAERAVALKPERSDYRSNLGMMLLTRGDFHRGWGEYEHRDALVRPDPERSPCDAPFWKGEPIAGKRILVHAEQGLGDTLQFARYLPPLAEMQAQVTFAVQPALTCLLEALAEQIKIVARTSELPSFDFQIAVGSLPLRFGTELNSIPSAVPYVSVKTSAIAEARERGGGAPRRRGGI